jgi:monothiol glutaredoxin
VRFILGQREIRRNAGLSPAVPSVASDFLACEVRSWRISYKMSASIIFPSEAVMSDVQTWIKETVSNTPVVLFMKGTAQFPQCGFSGRAIQILKACGVENIATVNVLDDPEVRQGIKEYSNWPTIPQLYVKGEFIGGSDIMNEMFESGELKALLNA